MGFSAKQLQALRRQPNRSHVRTREAHGRELTYLEGWYAISEANRIFGFDGWSRETIESRSVLARENRATFLAVYLARVRVTVQADGATIIREGHGTGEGRGTSPGEVHDIALKAAETDATKRALATFGRPFGLELYRGGKAPAQQKPLPSPPCAQFSGLLACQLHAKAQETNGIAAEAQRRVPPLPIATSEPGSAIDQPGAARLGELLRGRTFQRVLQLHQTLGRKEGPAPYRAGSETKGLWLEAVE